MICEKVNNSTLKVIKTVESTTEEKEYDINFLKQQEVNILKQKNDFNEARDKELVEVRVMLAEAEKLGIKTIAEVELENELLKEQLLNN